MNTRLDFLQKIPSLAAFLHIVEKEPSLLIEELWEAPKAALLALIAKATGKQILILSAEGRENRLVDDFAYFGVTQVLEFPSWETLPGEEISPSPDIVGKRYEILHMLLQKKPPQIIVCPLQACLQKVLSPKTLRSLSTTWKRGDEIPFASLQEFLTQRGYRRVPVVSDKGEFALRGGILDLFPLSSTDPLRLEFFGDELEQIRTFDVIGQKSIGKVETAFICPATEFDFLRKEKELALLLDYLGKDLLIVFDDLLALEDRYVALQKMPGALSPLFCPLSELLERAVALPHFFWTKEPVEELSEVQLLKKVGRDFYSGKEPLQPLSFHIFDHPLSTKRWLHPFTDIASFFSPSENKAAASAEELLPVISRFASSSLELHFLASTESEEKMFKERLENEKIQLPKKTLFEQGYLSSGFVLQEIPFALISLTELTHRYKIRRQKWRSTYHTPPSEFHELLPGDVVVHFHSGIGKYLGVEKRANHQGVLTEFLLIEYAENSKLYVPAAQSHLVSRYIGSHEELPTLSTLGTQRWQKTKLKAEQAIIGYAQDLLRLNAERTIQGGFTFPPDGPEMVAFENEFPFVETEDQLQAIADIKNDMASAKAMDRLICGDVGYGKTEVAMRAAFKAAADGKKQVAVLVPTTVLAMQHYETFKDRMANFPLNIELLSRFRSPKEIKETLKKAASGGVDILVGTHRLISKDVQFKNLGLIIIDEEQRFGVRAKEHLKALKAGVDCLTLSATPIPRTLYLSLIGAREISVINTPPQDRLPIKTILSERDIPLIQNALLRELSRDGQAFFIHNRVETIYQIGEEIQKILPQARILIGHGQMDPEEMDAVFHSFKSGQADILIATTIVENGIDIPNANTILIDRADTFGLADLYQLRGRVGRWNRPAYAYFLTPKNRSLPELTRKRLSALVEASGYGGGMKIAMRDLEIRGAGDILGTQQSGQISAVGFHLYCKLLKRAIDALRKKIPPSFTETKMEFAYDARLPEEYVNESSLRLEIYHRLGEAHAFEEVEALLSELQDRFGACPPPVLWLYHLTRIRLFASLHSFILLKFETHTLIAERQKGKNTEKKILSLPRTQKPEELEKRVIALLQESFSIK